MCVAVAGKHANGGSEWRGQLHHHRRAVSTMDEVMSASKPEHVEASPLENIAHAISTPGVMDKLSLSDNPEPPPKQGTHRRMGSR